MNVYQRQIAEEERTALRDRRKWLTERLVVLQSQGAGCPGDRAVIQHLRSELRACELRFEMRDRELMDAEAAEVSTCKTSLESQGKSRQPSPVSPRAAEQHTTQSPTQRPSSNPG